MRWSYEGLTLLKENNVYVICLPSHSTIFSQPNDAGINASFKAVFGQIVRQWHTTHRLGGPMKPADFSYVFVHEFHFN